MPNLIKCEFLKLKKSVAFKVILIIICFYGVMMTLTNIIQPSSATTANGIGAFLFALAEESTIVIIMGAVLAGIFICSDFENRTMQSEISCGHSRMSLLISKAITYFIALAFVMIPYPIIICVSMSIANGFGATLTVGIFLKLFASLISIIFINISALSVCVLLAFVIRKSGAVIGSCIAILALINVVTGVLSRVSSGAQSVLQYFPSIMGLGSKVLTIDAVIGDFIQVVSICLLCVVAILMITNCLFKRTELK